MLLPLADNNPLRSIRHAYVNWTVIGLCVAVFVYEISLPERTAELFALAYGAIPAVLFGKAELAPELARLPGWVTLVSSMFLHGGIMHIAGNMLFLWVLGDNVEDALGHKRYVAFYLACGVFAALAHALADPGSRVPMVGASGAISGVIGSYLILHPRAPIKTLVWLFIVELPAWLMLGIWAVFQFLSAFGSAGGAGGGVAWWAHVGGLVAGLALIAPLRRKGMALFDRGLAPAPRRGPRIAMRKGPWSWR
ncbi:MAG: rhomboid family intramembrane serine protease [Rhodospirillaceae bacterium]